MSELVANRTPDEAIVAELEERFRAHFGEATGILIVRAPGRVNLLGEHTDYNGGFVLPMTIDRAVWLALRARGDRQVRLCSANFEQTLDYSLEQPPALPAGGWASYVTGVIEELRQRQLLHSGLEAVILGDVPLGGGLSSSAALEVATLVALQALTGFALDGPAAARLCQQVEHRYAGVQCGIMDQFASRLGRRAHALFLDCRSLDYQNLPLPLEELRVVIVNSGVKRQLAGCKYDERRAECQQGVATLQRQRPSIAALRDATLSELEGHAGELPDPVLRRCRHVIKENQRVQQAAEHLRAGRLAALGELMYQSHTSLRDLYQVSCPELDALVELAAETAGVLGARMTGAGFGGCTVHLVEAAAVGSLVGRVRRDYGRRFQLEPGIFVLEDNVEAGMYPRSP